MAISEQAIQHKIDTKTKPLGALGRLEEVAAQIARIQDSLNPSLVQPHVVVFAASHGIANEGVSAYPSEVTYQMVLNFVNGGAAINVFTRQHGIALTLVDAGVDYDFDSAEPLIHAKINKGTASFLTKPAMTKQECLDGIDKGKEIVQTIAAKGCNCIGFGEMGIGNTSSAAVLMSNLLAIPIEECVGKGTGLDDEGHHRKIALLAKALANHSAIGNDVVANLTTFGGYEIVMMCGAFLAAAEHRMVILVDGFIASVAFLCASLLDPKVKEYAIFCHESEERGHRLLLAHLSAKSLLNLGMRLGEGTGCAVAYPIIQSALAFFNKMATFENAGVQGINE